MTDTDHRVGNEILAPWLTPRISPLLRLVVCLCSLLIFGCASMDYRFERIDGAQPVMLPLTFEGLRGLRDGAMVEFEGRFVNANDAVTLNGVVFLRPPAEFRSGT